MGACSLGQLALGNKTKTVNHRFIRFRMLSLSGYIIENTTFTGSRRTYYQARRTVDNQSVVIKTCNDGQAVPGNLGQVLHEYGILKELTIDGLVRPLAIENDSHSLALVLEAFKGESLKHLFERGKMTFEDLFSIFVPLVGVLDELHRQNVIHKDLQPENIFVDMASGQVFLTDFSFATLLPIEDLRIQPPGSMEGALSYISPEQTGRMNRPLDYRTDFYSVGTLLFRAATGRLPFSTTDPLELVHNLLAKKPPAPSDLDPGIPKVLSDIILRLLAKNAENRYQRAWGIKADLEECRNRLSRYKKILPFSLGLHDIPDRFQVFPRLYGREQERENLLNLFARCCRGETILATISGYSGIGKTSLVQEIYKPVTQKHGYFSSGKCDQLHRNVPYSVLATAIQELLRSLLIESDVRLHQNKTEILQAVGAEGQLIIDVVPDLELIIGPQPPVKEVSSEEAQIRFNRVFLKFVGILCNTHHPLVIFLDDLQWVDPPTLNLIELMVADMNLEYLCLIGAYRDNEVDPLHPLIVTLEKLRKETDRVHSISLSSLETKHVSQMLVDTLHQDQGAVSRLAELTQEKTGGNPFFIKQFLSTLYQKKQIFFDIESRHWKFELNRIQEMDVTENLIDLLIQRLKQMPDETQEMLRIASCIGNQFSIEMLSMFSGQLKSVCLKSLLPALREELITTTSGLPLPGDIDIDDYAWVESFKFRHDRIHQAAYALIEEAEKKSFHYIIGRVLLEKMEGQTREEAVFDILSHLNFARELLVKREECLELAELNLMGGLKAKASAAFEPAFGFIRSGLELLPRDCWDENYDLTLQLYTECVDSARICGHFIEMERWAEVVKAKSRQPIDKVFIYQNLIQASMSRNRLTEALTIADEILPLLGEPMPKKKSQADMHREIDATLDCLQGRTIEELLDLPLMEDPDKLAAMNIFNVVTGAAYISTPDLMPMIACRVVNLSIQIGNSPHSIFLYTVFGALLCAVKRDIEAGYRFGRLSLDLINRLDAEAFRGRAAHAFSGYINHWKNHLRETIADSVAGYQSCMEIGDFEFAGYNAYIVSKHSFLSGKELNGVEHEINLYSQSLKRHKQETPLQFNQIFHQAVLNLLGRNEDPRLMIGEAYDERVMVPLHEQAADYLSMIYFSFSKLILCYLFEDYYQAVHYAEALEELFSENTGGPLAFSVSCFYTSLARLALYPQSSLAEQEQILVRVSENQKDLKKWADHCPENYLHKYHLVAAVLSDIEGQDVKALDHFDQAISLARENEFINEEALANELASKFWLKRGRNEFATLSMKRAYQCNTAWGAKRKLTQLKNTYPSLFLISEQDKEQLKVPVLEFNPAERFFKGLDMATMLKSFQTISSEIELNKLLTTLMRIVIENLGAEIGFLVLSQENELMIAAQGISSGDVVAVQPFIPLTEEGNLPYGIIQYVARTKEVVVLENAAATGPFTADSYVMNRNPSSVLCAPILYQSELSGVVYLENNLAANMFSRDRLEVIKALSSQIAISIENANLYEDRKNAEARYRSIFENAVEGIFQTTPSGQFITANPAMARILGYDNPEDLVNSVTSIEDEIYVDPEDRRQLLENLTTHREANGLEISFFRKDGTTIWVLLHARPVFDKNGRLQVIEGFFADITERKRETEALRISEEYLRKENILLKSNFKDRYRFGDIIGRSNAMQEVYETITKAATANANVIVYGESGTGKELVAQAIHQLSDRKDMPFVPVNCGAIPENLAESEFFGYRKGAFTGAHSNKSGYLDTAEGGTLFLDELGEINANLQVKLLRVLEGSGYTPVGGQETKRPDVQFVSATNQNLQEMIKTGEFREDLFYRVHIIPINLPPLRDRREDIPLLIEHFMKHFGQGKKLKPIRGGVLEALQNHDWPGNVRELQNVIHRYVTLNQLDLVQPSGQHLTPEVDGLVDLKGSTGASYQNTMDEFEKKLLQLTLENNQWHRENSARKLGLPPRTFYRKLKKYNLSRQ
jgi:PAS domain S-box-containing protein